MARQSFFKRNKIKFTAVFMLAVMTFILGMAIVPGSATAGSAGKFDGTTVTQANQGSWVSLVFTGLTPSADYIVVEATWGNQTFSTGSGQSTATIVIKIDVSGTLTFNLYGYDSSTGVASGSVLDSHLLTVTASSTYNANQVTNLIPLFIGLLIAGMIISVAIGRKVY